MPHVELFLARLVSQAGDRYIFGHEVSLSDTDPDAFDCSELIEWAAWQVGVQPRVPDGSWYQARHCQKHGTLLPVSEGIETRGALLFRFSSSPFVGGRPTSSHVAVSLGDGRTIEARGSKWGVGVFSAHGRGWTHAGLVPGLDYSTIPETKDSLMFAKHLNQEQWRILYRAGIAKSKSEEALLEKFVANRDSISDEDWGRVSAGLFTDLAQAINGDGAKALQTLSKMKAVM